MRRVSFLLGCFFYSLTVTADLSSILQATAQAASANIHQGFLVQSMKANKVIYQVHPDHLFIPASILKILPAVASLKYLGPDYHISTKIIATAPIRQGVLAGDLYFVFDGDPSLKFADLNNMMTDLKNQGLKKVLGHVYIDNTAFDQDYYPDGRLIDDMSTYYGAPINAISLDKNTFVLQMKPGKKINDKVVLISSLPKSSYQLDNHLQTRPYTANIQIEAFPGNHYSLSGALNNKTSSASERVAITDPGKVAKLWIKEALAKNEIQLNAPIQFKALPSREKLNTLVTHTSAPLSVLVKTMLKDSDNYIADTLVKKLGQVFYKKTGTFSNGLKAMKAILQQAGNVDFSKTNIKDGSGLSRMDLISPRQMMKILTYAYHDPLVFPYFYQALSIPGVDGTLKGRMTENPRAKFIHAKTGSMEGVTCLAGYAKNTAGETHAFVLMTNGYVGKRAPYRKLEDQLALSLAK